MFLVYYKKFCNLPYRTVEVYILNFIIGLGGQIAIFGHTLVLLT
jgi:hypothetical protein